jgi:hypothetical protein
VPNVPAWRIDRVGEASALLEHADLPAWFDEPFVPFRYRAPHVDAPPVLVRARVELAPILYFPGVLRRGRYTDDIS